MQEVLVVLVVLGAVFFLGQRIYKSLFVKKTNCDVDCGCEATKSPVLEQLKNNK